MKWKTTEGYVIEEAVVLSGRGRPARILRVIDRDTDLPIGQYASWADLIVDVDVWQLDETA